MAPVCRRSALALQKLHAAERKAGADADRRLDLANRPDRRLQTVLGAYTTSMVTVAVMHSATGLPFTIVGS